MADLHVRTDVNDATINTLVSSCVLLKTLSLYHCRGITDKSLKAIADNCVHVTSLTLRQGTKITDLGLHYFLKIRGSSLTALSVRQCWALTGLSLTVLVAFCPHLTTLDIGATKVNDVDVMNVIIIPNALPQLKQLYAGDLHPTLVFKPALLPTRFLIQVTYYAGQVSYTITAALLKLICKKCVNLLSLTMNFAEDISAQVINDCLASDGLPLLTKLLITDSHGAMSDAGAVAIFTKHPILTQFSCDGVCTDLSLSVFACALALEHCPDLISYDSDAISFIWHPTGKCYHLCIYINYPADDTQLAIEIAKFVRLRPHHPVGKIYCIMDKMGHAAVSSIAANYPELTSVNLNVRADVNDETISTLVSSCKILQVLTLPGCQGITDSGLKAVADSCVHITSISVRGVI